MKDGGNVQKKKRRAEEEDFLNSHQRQKLNILHLSGVNAIQKLLVSG